VKLAANDPEKIVGLCIETQIPQTACDALSSEWVGFPLDCASIVRPVGMGMSHDQDFHPFSVISESDS
jgi:hypothetical protein